MGSFNISSREGRLTLSLPDCSLIVNLRTSDIEMASPCASDAS